MDETKVKTRLGLIIQGLVREALNVAGFTFAENYQYDPNSQEPDFLIPNENNPRFIIEVHQTEARNSFQMKVLRSFTAVIEAKIHYSNDLVSVNLLFGDPNNEVLASNVCALSGFFDVNLVPQYDPVGGQAIAQMESAALELAFHEAHDVGSATTALISTHHSGIHALATLLKSFLDAANKRMTSLSNEKQ